MILWVTSVAFGTTGDGRLLLASAGRSGAVRLWDPLTGDLVGEPLTGHGGSTEPPFRWPSLVDSVNSVAFGTTGDGRLLLASGSQDGTVRLWDPLTGDPASEALTGHSGLVTSVACSITGDGRLLLASGSRDGTVRLWDPLVSVPDREALTGHSGRVTSVAFGTTGDRRLLLASGSEDGTVRLWDPLVGGLVGGPLTGHRSDQLSQPTWWAAAGLFPPGVEKPTLAADSPHRGAGAGRSAAARWMTQVTSVAFTITARMGACCSPPPATTGRCGFGTRFTGVPVGGPLTKHRGGATKATSLMQAQVRMWVTWVAFGTPADGRLLLASASNNGTVRLWDPLTGVPVGGPLTKHRGPATKATRWMTQATRNMQTMVRMWVPAVAFGTTANGRLLLASGNDGSVRLWDALTGVPVGGPFAGRGDSVTSVTSLAFGAAADGRLLFASGSSDGSVRLWDPLTGVPVGGPFGGHGGSVTSLAFGAAADGRLLLASASEDRTVRLWDPMSNSWIATLHRRSSAWSVTIFEGLLAIGDDEGICVVEPRFGA